MLVSRKARAKVTEKKEQTGQSFTTGEESAVRQQPISLTLSSVGLVSWSDEKTLGHPILDQGTSGRLGPERGPNCRDQPDGEGFRP